ncbi:Alpha/Beta hydrolase protein [Baffinella frigidus]|nr:Alpha/Beta hydrolase protein [Cryptophyta sp. CCMP2293]
MVWETLVNLVCRPPRYTYDPDEVLGPKRFRIDGRLFQRTDVEVVNKRKQRLKCSHYTPVLEGNHAGQATRFPCVVYCHGNCGSRVDASDCLDLLLPQSISVFAFDFSGSGLSDGETISLGFYEQDDLMAVIEYLRNSGLVSRIGLWGRSMGAATSVLVAARDPSIAGMVLDSAFSSLTQVMYELANQYMKQVKVPKILINGAISVLRKSVQKKGNFDIRDVNPEEASDKCFIPALFAHADGDDFVLAHHSKHLYERYSGDKNIITFGGDHNSPRPAFFFDSVGIFFYNVLIENAEIEAVEPPMHMTPMGVQTPTYTAPEKQYGAATAAPELNARSSTVRQRRRRSLTRCASRLRSRRCTTPGATPTLSPRPSPPSSRAGRRAAGGRTG